tara:strand:+ start:2507 stop:3025 length:519 start_codon:yes stop_codon:yes gene_type:complete
MVELKSGKILLRHFTEDDAEAYLICHDKEATKNLFSVPKNLHEAKKEVSRFIKQYSKDTRVREREAFVIEYKGVFVGWIMIRNIKFSEQAMTSSVVSQKFRGRGIGTDVHKILLKYVFRKYKLKKIISRIKILNKASARMLEKSGYGLDESHELRIPGKKNVYVVEHNSKSK